MERKRSVIYSLWKMKRPGEERGEELQFAIKPKFLLRSLLRFLLFHKVMTFSCHGHLWKAFHNCTYHCMLWFPTSMWSFAIVLSVIMVKYRHLSSCWKNWLRNIKMNVHSDWQLTMGLYYSIYLLQQHESEIPTYDKTMFC